MPALVRRCATTFVAWERICRCGGFRFDSHFAEVDGARIHYIEKVPSLIETDGRLSNAILPTQRAFLIASYHRPQGTTVDPGYHHGKQMV